MGSRREGDVRLSAHQAIESGDINSHGQRKTYRDQSTLPRIAGNRYDQRDTPLAHRFPRQTRETMRVNAHKTPAPNRRTPPNQEAPA